MLVKIKLTERGNVPRKMRPHHNAATRIAYRKTAEEFHRKLALLRFTYHHGKQANYRPRSGDTAPYGSKKYYQSYAGRKRRIKGHRDPMVWTGRTRVRARTATIAATTKGATLRYRFNVFNFHPWMHEEFRRILPAETELLGRVFDRMYKKEFNSPSGNTKTGTV